MPASIPDTNAPIINWINNKKRKNFTGNNLIEILLTCIEVNLRKFQKTIDKIIKVTSGSNSYAAQYIDKVYKKIIKVC